jgi:predicted PurR-regulated permease PerM
MATVVIILAVLNSVGLIIIGIENPFVFGIISACFSFIPYFGTFIGGSIPFIFSLLTSDSPFMAFKILIFYVIIHTIENNILSPNIVGNSLRLNPLVIIVGIIGGGMVWGIPGMFAIVPLLAMLNIMSENVIKLHAYSFLLGPSGTRRHAITVENIKDFWNRVISRIKKLLKK